MKSKALGILASVLLLGAVQAHASVIVGDREWLQPVDFVNLSWNGINAVCPESSGGVCTGSLNSIDLNGYTWASVDDVNALFNWFIGSDELGPGPEYFAEADSAWASAFFAAGFLPTEYSSSYNHLYAITRSLSSYSGRNVTIIDWFSPALNDVAQTAGTVSFNRAYWYVGAFFYRDVAQVPEPTSLLLLGLGVLGAGVARRWKVT